jgi:hypothetical protein
LFGDHLHPVFRAQSDQRGSGDGMAGHQFESPLLRDRGQEQHAFHPRKSLADADARTSTEGKIGKFRAIVSLTPPVGIELFGLGEPARISMDYPGADH